MDQGVRPHRRQFVLWSRPARVGSDWRHLDLGPGAVLSHCPDLRVERAGDADGVVWTILGAALSTDPRHDTPRGWLAATRTDGVGEAAEGWAGRWLLVGPDRIHPDATALLGCLYGRDDDGELVVTSSPALSAVIGRRERREVADHRTLARGRGMTWFPPPATRFAGVDRLLPSQILHLPSGRPRPRRLLPPLPEADDDARLDEVVGRLTTTMARLPALADEVHLGLSAGRDSRAILAAGRAMPLRPFTRLNARMSVADRVLPPRIAAAVGLPHRYVRDGRVPGDRRSMLREHAAGGVAVGQVRSFLLGVRDEMSGVMTNGGGFALVSGFVDWRDLPAELPAPDRAATAICRILREPDDSPARGGLVRWVEWVHANPSPGLDWRDRMFLEQRRCGWQAAKEQVYDMQDLLRLPVLNAARTWAPMLAVPPELRLRGGVQAAIIARCAPRLLDFPFNPPDTAFLPRRPDLVARRRLWRAGERLARRLPLRLLEPGADD